MKNILEKIGAGFGVGGAVLISVNMGLEAFAFSSYLISNISWLVVSRKKNMTEIQMMTWVYTIITIVGLLRL